MHRLVDAPVLAAVWRGHVVESLHHGFVVEADDAGHILLSAGDTEFCSVLRSAAKPLQLVPLVTRRPQALDHEHLAVCCASHAGGDRHAALVADVVEAAGATPRQLVCGPSGNPPSPLKHGCSGNHAGLMLAARALDAPIEGYHRPEHPVQQAVLQSIARMGCASSTAMVPDGCGIPTFALAIAAVARAFAALALPGAAWQCIPDAMAAHADLIGSPDWVDVRIMLATRGRIVAKTGAEGLLCLALAGAGRGMAIKIADGSTRALGAVAMAALVRAGWLRTSEADSPELAPLRSPPVLDGSGSPVGCIRAAGALG